MRFLVFTRPKWQGGVYDVRLKIEIFTSVACAGWLALAEKLQIKL